MRESSAVSTGSVRIRKVQSGDLGEIMAINRKSFVLPYTSSVFREFYRDHRYAFLVAEANGMVVGYAMSRVIRRLNLRGLGVRRIGHIMSIAVDPDYRRRGIGRELLRRTMEALWGRDVGELRLEARQSNQLAREMYGRHGFREERILEGYYSDGEDGILMVLGRNGRSD